MAEDGDKKEEEKFELDSAGEAVAYITLEQARVLAMEHARDNQEFYGRRYARRELVWEVVSEEEGEDYYDLRLSYRPAGTFVGRPGTEQFIIDKIGEIRLRQRLAAPSRQGPSFLLLAGVGVVVVTVVAVGGLFAAGGLGGGDGGDSSGMALLPTSTPVPPIFTPTLEAVPSPTALPVVAPVIEDTLVPTPTPIIFSTPIPAPTPLVFPTPLPTPTPFVFPTPQPMTTPVVVVVTATPEPMPTPPPTFTPSPIPTPVPTATPRPTPTPTGSTAPSAGAVVVSFTGTGLQNTLAFTVASSPWELTWQSADRLTINLYDADQGGNLGRLISSEPSGSTLVYARTGNFYFEARPDGSAPWSVTVEVP